MPNLVIEKTRFYVDQSIYESLKSDPDLNLVIKCTPLKGKHPKGIYHLPHEIALRFIESKRGQYNWKKNKNFHQDSVPTAIADYFIG